MPDGVIQRGVGGRRRATRPVGLDQVHREAIGQQARVVAQQRRVLARAAREVQQRLALAEDLVVGEPAAAELGLAFEGDHRISVPQARARAHTL